MAKPYVHESVEQTCLFRWAGYMMGKYPELKLMYHIPNGGSRNKKEAANLKMQGVKAGVPDICLPVARGKWHSLYIEMKAGKNKCSNAQKEWIADLTRENNMAAVCYGWEAASRVIEDYLGYGREEENG